MKLKIILAMAALLLAGCNDNSDQNSKPTSVSAPFNKQTSSIIPQGAGFDFYVLSLSWSPHYCAANGRNADPQQCRTPKPFGFIVHGLWPQYTRGYPQYCPSNTEPSRNEIRSIMDLTPSAGLVRHEWEKHGTCSGLLPADYFSVMRAARAALVIPAQFTSPSRAFALSANQIENAFVQSNAGLATNSIAVSCERQKLTEVRICLSKNLQFIACPEVDRSGCKAQNIAIEPIK